MDFATNSSFNFNNCLILFFQNLSSSSVVTLQRINNIIRVNFPRKLSSLSVKRDYSDLLVKCIPT
ncbi:unknown [Salmonella phage FelixO1]|uniref:Uncharacterized protein n=1 Tax=Salmonella phage Felix O1 (isolate Felix O1-VT1) TaxID=1283336 RepID=Q6KGG8_BPFO1|nr:unknown [Salmonella phage FelixO1]